jgi:uncharacterized heparinase superfamily protein
MAGDGTDHDSALPGIPHGPGLAERFRLWRAGLTPPARAFAAPPEPRSIGLVGRGRQLVAGRYLLAGTLVEAPGVALWNVDPPDAEFALAAHGFVWLDDLAAAGNPAAQRLAQDWTFAWIARFGRGRGPGWAPDVTGRRLLRWVFHAEMLLADLDEAAAAPFWRALTRGLVWLSRGWRRAAPGLPRIEALTGTICSALAVGGFAGLSPPAEAALAAECDAAIDATGGIAGRNPEALLEVLTLLGHAADALADAGRPLPDALVRATARVAPTLRALRHADGGLARFHGGGRGGEGRLDRALARTAVPAVPAAGWPMGYARLSGGRTSVIVDAETPPDGAAAATAHASTLAFELTSGRRPLIVSCGSGVPFGADWRRAGRATVSHSTLSIEGFSSSRLGKGERLGDRAAVTDRRRGSSPEGDVLELWHDGWATTHGLLHMRLIELSHDGRVLTGEDSLGAFTDAGQKRLAAVRAALGRLGVRFALRFHLHPEVDASLDLGGTAVSMLLRSGEIWVFRHDGGTRLTLEPSVYLERGRMEPRPTRQIVLSGQVLDEPVQVGWTLAKAQDTPLAIRDLDRDDPVV